MLSDVGGWGVSECSGRPVFILFIKKEGLVPWPDIMLSQTLIKWSHPLMIPLHCLWAKSNNKPRVILNVTWLGFYFCFDFFRLHARCRCCSIVRLRFQVVQIKQVDYKMSTTMWIIVNKRHFVIFLNNCTQKSIKATKKQIVRLQLNEKK